jgi:hypothetical protein
LDVKNTVAVFALGALFGVTGGSVIAGVQIYPSPAVIQPANHYRVEISDGGPFQAVFVYRSGAQRSSNAHDEAAFAPFAFSGVVKVRVTKLDGPEPRMCQVLPSSRQITAQVSGRSATFELSRPGQFSVEFDGQNGNVFSPMLVFADPPETAVPKRGDPGVVWFGPGVHEVPGGELRLTTGQTVYLAPGAVVYGRILGRGDNIRILGRGILSGEHVTWADDNERHRNRKLCDLEGPSNDTLVDGPTFIDSPSYILTLHGSRHVVRNFKCIGWYFNTDGIGTGGHSLIEDCFLMCNDDALKLYHSDTTVRRCTIWQLENGAAFQISWNMNSDNSGFHVSDCDVIHTEHRWKANNTAVFGAVHGGRGRMSDYVFENIRIENSPLRLWNVTLQPNDFSGGVKQPGSIANLTFRNITTTRTTSLPNTFRGLGTSAIDGVIFENVRVAGKLVAKPEDANLEFDPATLKNVKFLP